jgi:hypothetical protein
MTTAIDSAQAKPKRVSDRLAEKLKQDLEDARDEYDALVVDLANGLDIDSVYIADVLRRAFPNTTADGRGDGDAAPNPARTLDADLRVMETRLELIGDIDTSDSLQQEKGELEAERCQVIEKLQKQLLPIEKRLGEIEVAETKRDRARGWLTRHMPRSVRRAATKVSREIRELQ